MLGAQAMGPSPGAQRAPNFDASKPLARPTTSESARGNGPVVLKGSCATMEDSVGGAGAAMASNAAAALGDANVGAEARMVMEGAALAGPAGAALAGALPMSGVLGRSALERLASESHDGIAPTSDSADPPRSEAERRKAALDAKRRDLVETRLRPQQPTPQELTEPRPPSQPRPDPRLGLGKPISPRALELEGSGL